MSAILDRRAFLAAAAALGFVGRAGADGPRALYAGARMDAQGAASLALFDEEGRESAAAPLPARAHDCALSPDGATLVVVARRPGFYALALDASTLAPQAAFAPPAGSHFYGHGAFCADGARFFATENAFASGDGAIGVYDARRGFARIGEWPSGGVGPHDLALTPDGRFLVVANGGIRTHPDTGRDILNRETMRPNLTLLSVETGEVAAQAELGAEARLSSIRHLALAPDGSAVFACQHEGSPEDAPPLVGEWSAFGRGPARLWETPETALFKLKNYVGSLSLDARGETVAATSPRGGVVAFYERASGRYLGAHAMPDVCGVAPAGRDRAFLVTSGAAGGRRIEAGESGAATTLAGLSDHIWDNHLLRYGA